MRRLLCTHRTVPADRLAQYARDWAELSRNAAGSAHRLWRFRHAEDERRFLEFVEWQGEAAAPLAAERRALDQAFGEGESSVWEEADPA